jgi:phosphoribosyl-dephospho-CoA transferase
MREESVRREWMREREREREREDWGSMWDIDVLRVERNKLSFGQFYCN